MLYNASFHGTGKGFLQLEMGDVSLIFATNIDCGCSLAVSKGYLQSMFSSQNKKIMNIPVNPTFLCLKWVFPGYSLHGIVNVILLDYFIGIQSIL